MEYSRCRVYSCGWSFEYFTRYHGSPVLYKNPNIVPNGKLIGMWCLHVKDFLALYHRNGFVCMAIWLNNVRVKSTVVIWPTCVSNYAHIFTQLFHRSELGLHWRIIADSWKTVGGTGKYLSCRYHNCMVVHNSHIDYNDRFVCIIVDILLIRP